MRKIFLFIIFLLLLSIFSFSAFSAIKFKDMPDDHWAARSVYNVVRLGITRGYPDGTFRGKKGINRYELMVFLSNLAISLEKRMDEQLNALRSSGAISRGVTSDKVIAELKAEVDALRASLIEYQQNQDKTWDEWVVSGDYTFRANHFQVSANEVDTEYISQRARLTLGRQSAEHGILFKLDTGFVNPAIEGLGKNITTNVLAVEAWAQTKLMDISTFRVDASAGPGDLDLNDYPSNGYIQRSGTIVYRPANALKLTWELFGFDLSERYEKRLNNVDRATTKLGYLLSLKDLGLGTLYMAAGVDTYSIGGESPTNSSRSIYEVEYKPFSWLTLSTRGARMIAFTTERIEYFSESKIKCWIPFTDTELTAEIDRLSADFYVDNVSDEIIAINILGYSVLPEFEAVGFSIKQYFFDRKFYLLGLNNTMSTMLSDEDLIHLYKESATQVEIGWKITEVASLSLMGRNTHYQLMNDPEYEELVDHLISGQFQLAF